MDVAEQAIGCERHEPLPIPLLQGRIDPESQALAKTANRNFRLLVNLIVVCPSSTEPKLGLLSIIYAL